MPSWLRELTAIVAMALGIAAGLAVVGVVVAAAGSSHYRTTTASALFIGGGIVIVGNAIAGGRVRGRRFDVGWSGTKSAVRPADSLAWVAVGLVVLAFGLVPAFVL